MNSWRAFVSDVRVLERWLERRQVTTLAITGTMLVQFADEQVASGKTIATVLRYFSSIAKFLRLAGLRDTTRSKMLQARLKRLQDSEDCVLRPRVPKIPEHLKVTVFNAMARKLPDSPRGLRDTAILLLIAQAGFSAADVVSLRFLDLIIDDSECKLVRTIRKARALTEITQQSLKDWIYCLDNQEGYVFRRIHRSVYWGNKGTDITTTFTIGGGMTSQSITIILRAMLYRAKRKDLTKQELEGYQRLRSAVSARSIRSSVNHVHRIKDSLVASSDNGQSRK